MCSREDKVVPDQSAATDMPASLPYTDNRRKLVWRGIAASDDIVAGIGSLEQGKDGRENMMR
ncbi:hypothetical protein PT974_01911 [Cladobotryum mycophilum]|uniref:Uncharacterized protein n=1 Tax=Cladobotryum mycophilum TaxID=491253 RepID=A0ABR0SX26_9HYPO